MSSALATSPSFFAVSTELLLYAALTKDNHVPKEKMEMALQTQGGTCGDTWTPCPDATTPSLVAMQVDWVEAYAYKR